MEGMSANLSEDCEHLSLQTANWRLPEYVGNHDQVRPGAHLRTVSLRPRMTEKGLGELAEMHLRAWGASIRDGLNSFSDE